MARPAKPFGRKPVDKTNPKPTDRGRQSSGPSRPNVRPPRGSPPPGGDPRQSSHGGHLLGNADKGGTVSYQ
jgi:hypothetical protein